MNVRNARQKIADSIAVMPINPYSADRPSPYDDHFNGVRWYGAEVIPFRRGFSMVQLEIDVLNARPGYTGPNLKLGDYYVREIERIGSEHRQVVRYEVVGTGRVEQMPRSRFDRQARAA